MDSKLFLKDLRKALCQVGFTMEQAEQYEFHGWRHYYTAYMSPNLSTKLLQTQTGHKTDTMIKRYGDHELQGEREIIRRALLDTFGDHLYRRYGVVFRRLKNKKHINAGNCKGCLFDRMARQADIPR